MFNLTRFFSSHHHKLYGLLSVGGGVVEGAEVQAVGQGGGIDVEAAAGGVEREGLDFFAGSCIFETMNFF